MKLSARLTAITGFVPRGAVFADIGTDHAYLPIDLVRRGVVAKAFASDVHDGPFRAAKKAVESSGFTEKIEVRMGDGLAPFSPGEFDAAAIAGMGGATIADILAKEPKTANLCGRFILQPMNAAAILRKYLASAGWKIADEDLVEEDGRLYEIVSAIRETERIDDDILYEIGPRLWEKRHPLLAAHLSFLLDRSRRAFAAMAASERAKSSEKYRLLEMKIERLKEKFQCL